MSRSSRPIRTTRAAAGSWGWSARTWRSTAGSNELTSNSSAWCAPGSWALVTRQSPTAAANRAPAAARSGSSRSFLISTFTPIPTQASRAASSVATDAGRSGPVSSAMARPSGSPASWWTTRTPCTVWRTSSSTQSAPSSAAWRTPRRCSPGGRPTPGQGGRRRGPTSAPATTSKRLSSPAGCVLILVAGREEPLVEKRRTSVIPEDPPGPPLETGAVPVRLGCRPSQHALVFRDGGM